MKDQSFGNGWLVAFLFINQFLTQSKIKTTMCRFNQMDFAYKHKTDIKLRPSQGGIRHENGYKIATDSHILCALKESYSEDLEGKTLMRDGTTNDGNFPKWRDIIPTNKGNFANLHQFTEYEVDLAKIGEFIKDAKRLKKEGKLAPTYVPMYVKIGDAYFKLELFDKIASLMKHLGTNKILTNGVHRAAFVSKDENYGLIMPVWFEYGNAKENEQVDGLYLNRVYTLA